MRTWPRILYHIHRLWWRLTRPVTMGVRLILEQDDRVMLVKHTYQRQWYLPGGGVRRRETLEQAARREAAEELGASLGELRLFGVYSNFFEHKSDHVIVFSCSEFAFTGQSDREIETFAAFHIDELPEGLSPGSRRRIEEYRSRSGAPKVGKW